MVSVAHLVGSSAEDGSANTWDKSVQAWGKTACQNYRVIPLAHPGSGLDPIRTSQSKNSHDRQDAEWTTGQGLPYTTRDKVGRLKMRKG